MQHFLNIARGIDVTPLLVALFRKPDLWNENTLRTEHPETAHADCSDIWLMFNDTTDASAVPNDREVIPYRAWFELPEAQAIVLDLMRRVSGVRLGRVIITKLPPGGKITPHIDGGAPAEYYKRFQVALQTRPGCLFKIGEETVQFQPGDVWLINNRETHGVINNSDDDRIAMVVDIRIE